VSVTIYVEGGGVGDPSLTKCRKGFGIFFERLLPGKVRVKVVACGSRSEAFRKFRTAHQGVMPGDYVILLVDSEEPVEPHVSPWDYLGKREGDKWPKPKSATDDQIHLMVQCMEAWFMADREAVVEHFDKGLKTDDLPSPVNGDIERISKATITAALEKAARKVGKAVGTEKRAYHKVQDGFPLLEVIDPERVCRASQHVDRLRGILESILPDRP